MVKKAVKRHPKKRPNHKAEPKTFEIAFDSPEFPHHTKNELWYIGIGLLLLAGFILALRSGNYLLSLVDVAAGLAVLRIARETPAPREIEIGPRGVRWGDKLIGYHQLKSFWVTENDRQLTVYLEQPNFAPVIHFVVPDDKVELTLTALSFELPFHYHKTEPFSDQVNRLLRI